MELWFKMNQTYSKRDQLSFMYCIWKTNLSVHTINLNVWNNSYFIHQIHNKYPPTRQCSIYYGSPDKTFDYNKFYTYQYTITNHAYSISWPYSSFGLFARMARNNTGISKPFIVISGAEVYTNGILGIRKL